jgi:hypothetical protein
MRWVRQLHEIPDVMSRGFIGFSVSEQWLFATVCRLFYLTIPAKSPSSTLLPICHGKERQSQIHSLPYDGSIGDIVWSFPWRTMRDLYFISHLTQPGFSSASGYRSDLDLCLSRRRISTPALLHGLRQIAIAKIRVHDGDTLCRNSAARVPGYAGGPLVDWVRSFGARSA